LRDAAETEGRDPSSIKVLAGVGVIVGDTTAEAQAKYDHYAANGSVEGALTLFGGWTGVDLSGFDPGDKMSAFESQGMQYLASMFGSIDGEREWTFQDVCDYMKVTSILPVLVGTVTEVADQLEMWMDVTDLDGFNLLPVQNPGDFEEFVDKVVPELQKRGRMRTSYEEGATLRELVYGSGQAQLRDDHPARGIMATTKREPIGRSPLG
jgi:alkanesulfonate monooxygenase SsuD/methylene tetrahydromethanopterin reductase-like flavin-dependent oxidoreductase (luciferase family)